MSDNDVPPEVNKLSRRIIGAAIEVHRHLGPGVLEAIYQRALAKELGLRGIPFRREVALEVIYKGEPIKKRYVLDFIIDASIVVEVKAVAPHPSHRAQLLSQLHVSGLPLGLLLNFRGAVMKEGISRLANTRPRRAGTVPMLDGRAPDPPTRDPEARARYGLPPLVDEEGYGDTEYLNWRAEADERKVTITDEDVAVAGEPSPEDIARAWAELPAPRLGRWRC